MFDTFQLINMLDDDIVTQHITNIKANNGKLVVTIICIMFTHILAQDT